MGCLRLPGRFCPFDCPSTSSDRVCCADEGLVEKSPFALSLSKRCRAHYRLAEVIEGLVQQIPFVLRGGTIRHARSSRERARSSLQCSP